MILYHVTRTRTATAIRSRGFRDSRRHIGHTDDGKPVSVSGVWFSDRPWVEGANVEPDDVPEGYALLRIDVNGHHVRRFEVKNEGAPYREWCIPAAVANKHLIT